MVLDFAKEAISNVESHSINFDDLKAGKANIKVIGVGGCGANAVTWLFNKGISGATVYATNTDALHLSITKADDKILIGKELTRGLGAGGKAEVGREAAKESISELKKAVSSADMIFIIGGEGGGTATGAMPVIAQLAKETGAVVIGVVTMPFECEKARIDKAEFGLQELREQVDTAIVIDNNRLVDIAGQLPIQQAFAVANACWIGNCPAMSTSLLLSMTIAVSTCSLSSCKPNSALSILAFSHSKGIVTTPITTAPVSLASCAITGIAPVAVPPPSPPMMKIMSALETAFLSSEIDSFAASLPTSAFPPAPNPLVSSLPIRILSSDFVMLRCKA